MSFLPRYRQLLDELVQAREDAGGVLSEEEEERRAEALNVVYWQLTPEEQLELDDGPDEGWR